MAQFRHSRPLSARRGIWITKGAKSREKTRNRPLLSHVSHNLVVIVTPIPPSARGQPCQHAWRAPSTQASRRMSHRMPSNEFDGWCGWVHPTRNPFKRVQTAAEHVSTCFRYQAANSFAASTQ